MISNLPNGWIQTTFGEVTIDAQQRQPQPMETFTYVDISSLDRDTKRVISPQNLSGEKASSRARKIITTGDVLVSMTRPNLNAVTIIPKDLDKQIASTGFDVLRAVIIDPRWLFYLVRTEKFVSSMSDLVQGALYPAIKSQDIRNYNIPLAPLVEQKRIADKLDSLLTRVDACREHLDRVPGILKRFRQAVLAAATSGRLTEVWRGEYKFGEIEYEGKTFPSSWEICTFDDVLTLIDGDRGPNYPKKTDYQAIGHCLFLSTKNVREFGFQFDDVIFISEKKHKTLRSGTVQNDDVVITTRGTLGNVAYYDESIPYKVMRINSGMLILRKKTEQLIGKFLMICVASPYFSDQLDKKRSGSAQPQIPANVLKTFTLPLPSLKEQQEIIRRVEILFYYADRLEARYQAARRLVDKLAPALLAKAFRGELVPQDPNDEPASMLLERIREARANAPKEIIKSRRRSDMKRTKKTIDGKYIGIVEALKKAGRELSAEQLLQVTGYPFNSESELVEEFFVNLRDSIINNQVKKRRLGNEDWFSLKTMKGTR